MAHARTIAQRATARDAVLEALGRLTAARLRQRARAFAKKHPPGRHHPLRCPAESRYALDRDRLALFHAALGARMSWANGLLDEKGCQRAVAAAADLMLAERRAPA